MVKTCDHTTRSKLPVINPHDQSAFCAFQSFLVEVQTNAGYIQYHSKVTTLSRDMNCTAHHAIPVPQHDSYSAQWPKTLSTFVS